MSIKVVGIDIAKDLFQVCVQGTNGQMDKWTNFITQKGKAR